MDYGIWTQRLPSLLEDVSLCHDCSAVVRLCSHSCECCLQLFPMPVVRRETDFDVCFLFHYMYCTEHDTPDDGVHAESLHLSIFEHGVLHPMCKDKGCPIEEQAEVVGTV